MMLPEFIRFYPYTAQQALSEFAVTFFSLVNSMYRLKAMETLDAISATNASEEVVENLQKQAKGLHGIVQEVRTVKGK